MSTDTSRQSELLTLLGNSRRRDVIWTLAAVDTPVDVETLTGFVISLEAGTTSAAARWNRRRSIRHNLKQRHLPQLAAAGVVEWTDTVSPGPQFTRALQTLAVSYVPK